MRKQPRDYEALEDVQNLQLTNQRDDVVSSDSLSFSLLRHSSYGLTVTTVVKLGEDMSH